MRLCDTFVNSSSADIELSKTQISKMIQSGGFLVNLAAGLLDVAPRTGIEAPKKVSSIIDTNATNYFVNEKTNELNKIFITTKGSGKH